MSNIVFRLFFYKIYLINSGGWMLSEDLTWIPELRKTIGILFNRL
jgi:hypothetical protein